MNSLDPTLPPPPELLAEPDALAPTPPQPHWLSRLGSDYALLFLLALTLIVNLALFAYLFLRFDALPDPLPLHFDATGQPDRIDAKAGIFALPQIGLIVALLNLTLGVLIHRRERAAARLFAAGALLTQVLMWLAVIRIVGGFV